MIGFIWFSVLFEPLFLDGRFGSPQLMRPSLSLSCHTAVASEVHSELTRADEKGLQCVACLSDDGTTRLSSKAALT